MDVSKQLLYADQVFASVTIKNSGTTSITGIQAWLLIADADGNLGLGNDNGDCTTGSSKALISTTSARAGTLLSPGESVTINGSLYSARTINATTNDVTAVNITCGMRAPDSTSLGTTANQDIQDRTEYIIQVDGFSEGGDIISTTSTVRAR